MILAAADPHFSKKEKKMASKLYLNLKEEIKVAKSNSPECKGLTFRGYSSVYTSSKSRGVEKREGIKLLKKKSCPGCEKCSWLLDDIPESIACKTLILPEIEHGALYSLRVTNESRDYESGYVDDYDLEFYKIKEDKALLKKGGK